MEFLAFIPCVYKICPEDTFSQKNALEANYSDHFALFTQIIAP